MDINEALDRVNELSPTRLFVLKKETYWFYNLSYVDLDKPPVSIMGGSHQLVTVFLLGILTGMNQPNKG